ncbi:MAG: hypothetical protein ACLRMN_07100 [Mediterraneibacter gnavus]
MKMDNLNLITSDFVFSGNFDGCLPQKVGVSAPVLKETVLWGQSTEGRMGDWLYCWSKSVQTSPQLFSVNGNPAYQGRAYFCYGRSHNGHQIDKVIIVEHIDPGKEPAGIIDQGNDIVPVFFPSESVRRGPALLSPHQTSLI